MLSSSIVLSITLNVVIVITGSAVPVFSGDTSVLYVIASVNTATDSSAIDKASANTFFAHRSTKPRSFTTATAITTSSVTKP